jgi:hypothetical protein
VRVACVALDDGSTLLALQLHHAVGDGRASFFFTARLFALWRAELGQAGQVASAPPLAKPALGDARALLAIAGNPRAALNLRNPACRILAARGAPLVRASDAVGRPIVRSFTVPLPSGLPGAVRRDLFYGALLAGLRGVLAAGESPIRLRIPVDLRPLFQIGATLENACSAIPIEIPRAWLSDLPTARARTLSAIVAATEAGVALGVLLETMLVARLATRAMLRDHLRPDMIAPRRANTMVTTYLGTVDRYLGEAPFPICDAFSHTPTWGVTAFSFRAQDGDEHGDQHGDRLVLNVGSFEGLWGEGEYARFFGALEEALPMLFKASGLAWKSGEGSGGG